MVAGVPTGAAPPRGLRTRSDRNVIVPSSPAAHRAKVVARDAKAPPSRGATQTDLERLDAEIRRRRDGPPGADPIAACECLSDGRVDAACETAAFRVSTFRRRAAEQVQHVASQAELHIQHEVEAATVLANARVSAAELEAADKIAEFERRAFQTVRRAIATVEHKASNTVAAVQKQAAEEMEEQRAHTVQLISSQQRKIVCLLDRHTRTQVLRHGFTVWKAAACISHAVAKTMRQQRCAGLARISTRRTCRIVREGFGAWKEWLSLQIALARQRNLVAGQFTQYQVQRGLQRLWRQWWDMTRNHRHTEERNQWMEKVEQMEAGQREAVRRQRLSSALSGWRAEARAATCRLATAERAQDHSTTADLHWRRRCDRRVLMALKRSVQESRACRAAEERKRATGLESSLLEQLAVRSQLVDQRERRLGHTMVRWTRRQLVDVLIRWLRFAALEASHRTLRMESAVVRSTQGDVLSLRRSWARWRQAVSSDHGRSQVAECMAMRALCAHAFAGWVAARVTARRRKVGNTLREAARHRVALKATRDSRRLAKAISCWRSRRDDAVAERDDAVAERDDAVAERPGRFGPAKLTQEPAEDHCKAVEILAGYAGR